MPTDLESLTIVVNETKATLTAAAKTIRSLIGQRNEALGAADPEAVREHHEAVTQEAAVAGLQAGLEAARQDLQAAINEAGAPAQATQPQPQQRPAPVPEKAMSAGTHNPSLP